MRFQLPNRYDDIISVENLLLAWQEFVRGKRGKRDVQDFSLHLMDNIFALHDELCNGTYSHGPYHAFNISDPKPRNIHKANVRDRLVHHAIHRILYPFFDRTFIADSYSCRLGKGTHKAIRRFRVFGHAVGKNNTRTCWVLKCDIRKFFASIDHAVLLGTLEKYIFARIILGLLENVICSFEAAPGKGLPLGNLTSQLLVNIYMNEFDQFVKHRLRAKYYIRYADDFVILSESRERLERSVSDIKQFLKERLQLRLHPDKVFIKSLASGIDFLGWICFPDHRVFRTTTKCRMLKRMTHNPTEPTVNSYLGMLRHGNAYKLASAVRELYANQ